MMMMTMTTLAVGGVGILAVAFLATSVLRSAPASLRHLIWLAGLGAILALPLLEGSGLDVRVPVPGAWLLRTEGTDLTHASLREDGRTALASISAEVAVPVGPAELADPVGAAELVDPLGPAELASPADPVSPVHPAAPEASPVAHEGSVQAEGERTAGPGFAAGTLLAGIWAAGVLWLLAVTALQHLQARRLTVHGVAPARTSARRRLDRLRTTLGIARPVGLVVNPGFRVPATWGIVRSTVVLPPDYVHWSAATLDRVLLHELAHVQRRDCAAYLVGEIARAVHWPNPLAWLALARLRIESERASDDRVLRHVGAPSAYAEDLVSIARAVKRGPALPRAAIAMASRSGVSARVRAILDPVQRRGGVAKPVVLMVGLVAVALASVATVLTPTAEAQQAAAPQERVQERSCVFRDGARRSTSMHVDDEDIRIRWESDGCQVDVDIVGRVEFAADDGDVMAVGPDARFEIEERSGLGSRRVRIEAGPDGTIERRYWDGGDEAGWGEEARSWLARILPEIFRHSTINAEARVRRMLDEGGPDRVFREVEPIRSDHVTRRYLELMMELGQLTESDYGRVIDVAGGIESDHGSATLLLSVIERAGLRPAFQDPLLRASEGLGSDHQRTRVLEALLDHPLEPEQLDGVLRSASSIESDHNLSRLLSRIAGTGRLDDAGRASFLQALGSIESDHSHGLVVGAFLDAGPLTDEELAQVLTMTEGIDSDHERGKILRRVAEEYPLRGSQVTAYLRSASRLGSDHETARTARAVIERADFDREQTALVLRMADDVGSDHNRGEILLALIRRRELGSDEVGSLLAVARGLGSDHRLAETLSLLIEEQELDAGGVEGVLSTLEGVGSDHRRVTVMTSLARRFAIEGRARALYEGLAADLGRRDRDRVLAAISR